MAFGPSRRTGSRRILRGDFDGKESHLLDPLQSLSLVFNLQCPPGLATLGINSGIRIGGHDLLLLVTSIQLIRDCSHANTSNREWQAENFTTSISSASSQRGIF